MCDPTPCPRCRTGIAELDPGRAANDLCASCRPEKPLTPEAIGLQRIGTIYGLPVYEDPGMSPNTIAVVTPEGRRTLTRRVFLPPCDDCEARAECDYAEWEWADEPTEDSAMCGHCGHIRSDHAHEPPGTPMRMTDGMCLVEGCGCSGWEVDDG